MQVSGSAVHATQTHGLRERRSGNTRCLVAHQFVAGQLEQVRLLFHLFAVPALKAMPATHVSRQLLVVKRVDQLVIDQHVLAARLVLQVFHLLDEFLVGREER